MATRSNLDTWLADNSAVSKAQLRQLLREGVNDPWVDVASAATTSLAAAGSRMQRITGTAAIASFGNADEGYWVLLRFAGAATLVHSASLALPWGQDLLVEAGAECLAVSLPGNQWVVLAYTPATRAGGRLVAGLAGDTFKDPVVVASTSNITLSGTQTIDGIGVLVGDRVLVAGQSVAAQNGIWIVGSGPWTRAPDAATWSQVQGAVVMAQRGTVGAARVYVCAAQPGGTVGVTAMAWQALAPLTGPVSGRSDAVTLGGTAVDVTGIPSNAWRVHLAIGGMSTNGTAIIRLLLGTAGGFATSGYLGSVGVGATFVVSDGVSWRLSQANAAANIWHGVITLVRVNAATNLWSMASQLAASDAARIDFASGSIALTAALERVRLATTNGTDTFDAGVLGAHWDLA